MPLVLPPPSAIIRPPVVEPYSMAEVYADGGVCKPSENGALAETILYRIYAGERVGILRVIMLRQAAPEDGFDVSLVRAYVESVKGGGH